MYKLYCKQKILVRIKYFMHISPKYKFYTSIYALSYNFYTVTANQEQQLRAMLHPRLPAQNIIKVSAEEK